LGVQLSKNQGGGFSSGLQSFLVSQLVKSDQVMITDAWTDMTLPHVAVFFLLGPPVFGKRLTTWLRQLFSFYPGTSLNRFDRYSLILDTGVAVNIEHRTERTGAFVSLVFGYTVVALLYQNQASFGMNA